MKLPGPFGSYADLPQLKVDAAFAELLPSARPPSSSRSRSPMIDAVEVPNQRLPLVAWCVRQRPCTDWGTSVKICSSLHLSVESMENIVRDVKALKSWGELRVATNNIHCRWTGCFLTFHHLPSPSITCFLRSACVTDLSKFPPCHLLCKGWLL